MSVNYLANVPQHIAIIMDGNGRWAIQRKLPRMAGHKVGLESARRIIKVAQKCKIHVLTLFIFGCENWGRSTQEVNFILKLFLTALKREVKEMQKNNIRFRCIGNWRSFDQALQQQIVYSQKITANNDGLQLNIAANYSGRWDIVNAAKTMADKVQKGVLSVDEIDETQFSKHTALYDLPDPDLLIRTSGEQRISNFLLWQISYTEFYFPKLYWPEFNEQEFIRALKIFAQRKRRFGLEETIC